MMGWAPDRLKSLESIIDPAKVAAELRERNLFPEVDELHVPPREPPESRWWNMSISRGTQARCLSASRNRTAEMPNGEFEDIRWRTSGKISPNAASGECSNANLSINSQTLR
jgi:hypothetical protein